MSKSKGNVADPLEVMEKYGTDAFRFTLAALAQGRDIRISEERIEGYRNFANKIWNASRLVLSNLDGYDPALAKETPPALADVWIESRLAATVARRSHGPQALPVQRRGLRALPVPLARVLRLVSRDRQAVAVPRRESGPARAHPGDARSRARGHATAPASVHAVHHRGALAAATAQGRIDHAGRRTRASPRSHRNLEAERQMTAVMELVTAVRNIRGEMRIAPGAALAATLRPRPDAAATSSPRTRR